MRNLHYTLITEFDELSFINLDSMLPSSQYRYRRYMKDCVTQILPFKMVILWI